MIQCTLCGHELIEIEEYLTGWTPKSEYVWVFACGNHKITDLVPIPTEILGLPHVKLRARSKVVPV